MAARKKAPSLRGIVTMDVNCSEKSKQGGVDRYDGCSIQFRTERGKNREVVPIPGQREGGQYVGTIFVGTHPERAFQKRVMA